MISLAQRQTTANNADAVQLLARAKAILSRWNRLHMDSVRIGIFQPVAYSGVLDAEIEACRKTIEQADTLCADIDQLLITRQQPENGRHV